MTVNIIPLVMLIAYSIIIIGVANIVLRKKLGSDHFLVAGRSLPLMFVVAIVLGDMVGGPSTVGVCQSGYSEGIGAIFYPLALGGAMCIFASTMSARFRRLRAVTIPEVIGTLFDKKTRLTTGIVIAIAYFFIGISQLLAGGALLSPLLGIDLWLAKLITVIVFILIIVAGGLRSIALVNIVQVGVIFTGVIISLIFSLILVGGSVSTGISRIWNELPPSFWDLGARNPLTVSGEALGTIFAIFAAQAAITGIFAAKDQKTAVAGAWYAGLLYFPIGFAFAIIGLCSRLHFGDALPYGLSAAPAIMLEMNPILAGVALCGLFAAIMSTGPLVFLAPIQILVKDIYIPYINPDASDKKLLRVNRVLTLILLPCAWVLAVTFQEILKIQYWAFALRAGIAVILLSLTYLGSRRVSEDGAFGGLITGLVVFVLWTSADSPYGIHVAIPSMASVFVATLIISKFRKRRNILSQEVEEALNPSQP